MWRVVMTVASAWDGASQQWFSTQTDRYFGHHRAPWEALPMAPPCMHAPYVPNRRLPDSWLPGRLTTFVVNEAAWAMSKSEKKAPTRTDTTDITARLFRIHT